MLSFTKCQHSTQKNVYTTEKKWSFSFCFVSNYSNISVGRCFAVQWIALSHYKWNEILYFRQSKAWLVHLRTRSVVEPEKIEVKQSENKVKVVTKLRPVKNSHVLINKKAPKKIARVEKRQKNFLIKQLCFRSEQNKKNGFLLCSVHIFTEMDILQFPLTQKYSVLFCLASIAFMRVKNDCIFSKQFQN